MENHPIPQDVMGFQFKLIGNMTVKQFAYLATGVVLAWVFLQLPISFLIKFPLSAFFAILGIGLAFFPINGRPVDAMIGSFIKALLRPTQFVYEKTGGQLYYPDTKVYSATPALPFQQKDKLKDYLASEDLQKNKPRTQDFAVRGKIDEKENNFLMSVTSLAADSSFTPNINPTLNIPKTDSFKPAPAPKPISDIPQTKIASSPVVEPVQKLINPVPTGFNRNIGMPDTPNSPNLITGITKDARGNVLSNILIEVKDKEGNPVRAFKTNEFGRFASSTPMFNGSYTIEFEDPKGQNKFEKGIINATGQIIQPIAAISIDSREELRRSLFSTNN